ncbi:MAG TPA: hypothetical protein VKS44_06550 [Candidatus Acidoferrales bacterium]|nr:hypothetical protein [Candidatus Acidoferrales bacterium]
MSPSGTVSSQLERAQKIALVAGLAGVALVVLFALLPHAQGQFFRSYLYAFVFWLMVPMGCIAILMLHHLTGGWWGYPIRRLLEAGSRTFALMAVLFLPLFFGLSKLYPWANPVVVNADPILQHKKWYMTTGMFTARTVIYFAAWLLIAVLLNRWSREQDRTGDPRLTKRMGSLSGPGLILWGLVLTWASVDWVMSIESHWFSTIYGMLFMVIAALTAMCFVLFVLRMLSDEEPLKDCVPPKDFNDLGNLMLTFVMLWAYLSFSQFLIIWEGNLKDEVPWYITRAFGGWAAIAVVLMVLHFGVPFLLLLQRPLKRRLRSLSVIAAGVFFLSMVDVYWLVVPAFESERKGPYFHPLDFVALLAIGGLWVAAFLWQLRRWPLLPQHDPRFEGALEHAVGE